MDSNNMSEKVGERLNDMQVLWQRQGQAASVAPSTTESQELPETESEPEIKSQEAKEKSVVQMRLIDQQGNIVASTQELLINRNNHMMAFAPVDGIYDRQEWMNVMDFHPADPMWMRDEKEEAVKNIAQKAVGIATAAVINPDDILKSKDKLDRIRMELELVAGFKWEELAAKAGISAEVIAALKNPDSVSKKATAQAAF